MARILKPTRRKSAKPHARIGVGKATVKHVNCRKSARVAEFERWMLAHANEVGKWARQRTKRLTGKEIL